MLDITQYISRCNESYKSTDTWHGDFSAHPFFEISSPDNCTGHSGEYKSDPYEECNMYSRHTWSYFYQKRECHHHEKCGDKFCNHNFPHSLHGIFHLSIIETIFSVMDSHPEFSKQRTMPEGTKSKTCDRHDNNHHPRESNLHKRKDKK